MDDPWDVKSVRQSGQYVSCMKINGVPLLPPVLSKDCRKEMQYYKLLAKEVEKRIAHLKPLVDEKVIEDITEVPGDPEEFKNNIDLPKKLTQSHVDMTLEIAVTPRKLESSLLKSPTSITAKTNLITPSVSTVTSPRLIIDLNLDINDSTENCHDIKGSTPVGNTMPIEIPEHDYDYEKPSEKDKTDQNSSLLQANVIDNNKSNLQNIEMPYFHDDQPSSLSSKSFTGSLNNLHSDNVNSEPKLIRQSSYTLLTPSPQLLAHLQIQSINTGVEMTSISMIDSLSNITSPNKKRRSWDLESAKLKWSSMALELKQHNAQRCRVKSAVHNSGSANQKSSSKISRPMSPIGKCVYDEKSRPSSLTRSATIGTDFKNKRPSSPVTRTYSVNTPDLSKESLKQKKKGSINKIDHTEFDKCTPHSSELEDPATKIRELYDKVQKQQLIQMAALIEKQKKEQQRLHQAFEEQRNLLFKQLKTICPKPQMEVKQAWKAKEVNSIDRGPVSLKQLITDKSSDVSISSQLSSSTLVDANKQIVHCEQVLKKSKDLTGSIKKDQDFSNKIRETSPDGNQTRTHSPKRDTPVSRKLNYDTSVSSDREYNPILSDRTNDTFADLNVTFPSDHSDELPQYNTAINQTVPCKDNSIEYAIRNMEQKIINSLNDMGSKPRNYALKRTPTEVERAAASKIVAYARGYLVRRLMRTERVQTTVQTIKDALLCALQLHQERDGIKGADVDLHRRLIQQITAACYSLHDTFISSTPAERCAMIDADRNRRSLAALRASPKLSSRTTDTMSQSHLGVFVHRATRPAASAMTQSNYESFSGSNKRNRFLSAPNRRPWR